MKELYRFRQFLTEGDFKNPILDKYLKLKKSIDNKTVFDYELSDFINDLDNTERKGLESDLGLERDELYEGRLLKEELTPLQQYVYDYEKEVSGEDNAKEFLDGIKKLNTPNDVYDYYAFERNWEGDSDLEGDLENIYNQVLDKFKSKNK